MKTVKEVYEIINKMNPRSCWNKGVKEYALELLKELQENIDSRYINEQDLQSRGILKKSMLNGADNWQMYSEGGCALIYDCDIAERLCTPYELKRTRHGELKPNSVETWIDTQTRALQQAYNMIVMEMFY